MKMIERLFYWGVMACICGVVLKRRHLLRLLLLLEVLVFRVFVGRVVSGGLVGLYGFSLIILGVGACEAAVGLGMLIGFARVRGGDFVGLGLLLKV